MRPLLSVLAVLALVVGACTSADETAEPSTAVSEVTALPPAGAVALASFGTMDDVPLLDGSPAYAGPPTPTTLAGALITPWVRQALAEADAEAMLAANGFVIVPSTYHHFFHVYQGAEYEGHPVLVTTDAAYHVWHLVFDKILREAEQQSLLPVLDTLVTDLVTRARVQENELAGSVLADDAARVRQYYEAIAVVLELDVGPIGPLAEQEVALILDHSEVTDSPTIGTGDCRGSDCIDYTLYRPRGHYTRNADLERYFRAMSALGNTAFLLGDEMLRRGVLATRVLLSDPELTESWQRIYEPTAFLVGAADDYTPFELSNAVEATIGWDGLDAITDPAVIEKLANELTGTRRVQINPEASSVRLMGVRLVLDAYVMDQLVHPNVEQRQWASPLDLAAAFGSDWAYDVIEDLGETDYPGYDEQLTVVSDLVAARTIDDWSATVYDGWLWALAPMWAEHGGAYPDFMQTDTWAAKAHQTGFGSYTELKHDTILYAKQAGVEGGGEEPPVPPRHWVEPEPVVFHRLAELSALMSDGLAARDLLPDQYRTLLSDLVAFYQRLRSIAADELAGLPLSTEDNDFLASTGSLLETMWLRSSDIELDLDTGPDSQAALVADIMRSGQSILELGTGYVDQIFVLVPDDDGSPQVAVGAVYSYYEFWRTEGDRLTDEEWRAMLAAGEAPDRPTWQDVMLSRERTPGPGAGADGNLGPGLLCRDVANAGYGIEAAVGYWLREGRPDRMDADGNGIPCETVFAVAPFFAAVSDLETGFLCRELLEDQGVDRYASAVAYWLLEGAPARMDADGNGVPCETVWPADDVAGFLNPDR
ncbi:MAG: DUF3160 domain-containing protein [Acidimicrobiia bacterium]|nr:DUF3160 domain-containing protein [Acidimicrobiia bacterium]